MKISHLTLLVSAGLALSACSNAPSESDAKRTVQNIIGDCRYFSLENFEKVNGVAQGERNHLISIKYSVKVKTFPDSKKIAEDILTKLNEIDKKMEEVVTEKNKNYAEYKALDDRLNNEKDRAKWAILSDEKTKFTYEKFNPSVAAFGKLSTEKTALSRELIQPLITKFKNECPSVNGVIFEGIYGDAYPERIPPQFAKGFLTDFGKEFTQTILMTKTDKGWM